MTQSTSSSSSTLPKKDQKKLIELTSEWEHSKEEQQQINAKELDLRMQITSLLVRHDLTSLKVNNADNTTALTYTRKKNFSIPKAGAIQLRTKLGEETFNKLFTSTYKLKDGAYNLLESKSKSRKQIDKHLTIKDAPLSVAAKAIEEA